MKSIVCEFWRGGIPESVHQVDLAVAEGEKILLRRGVVTAPVFMRSCAKPFQTFTVVESGAADAFGFGDREIAIMSASHLGQPEAIEAVKSILSKSGLEPRHLQCGAHAPFAPEAIKALHVSGAEPGVLHNNCSGKHAGMVAAAKHLAADLESYLDPGHVLQKRNRETLARFACLKSSQLRIGIDGCSAPTFALPLAAIARAMAAFCSSNGPAQRVAAGMMAFPDLVGRPCGDLMKAAPGRLIGKVGAEGVYVIGLPGRGIGLALKVRDGNTRPIVPILAAMLRKLRLLSREDLARLDDLASPELKNHAGKVVGLIKVRS